MKAGKVGGGTVPSKHLGTPARFVHPCINAYAEFLPICLQA